MLTIYLLENGHYLKSAHSPNFPHIPLTQIIPATVERSWQVGTVQALEEFAEQVDIRGCLKSGWL